MEPLILDLSPSSVNKHPFTILGAKVPYYPKDLTNIKMTAHCYYLWKMSDRTYFTIYWHLKNKRYLGHNYCWNFDSSEYTWKPSCWKLDVTTFLWKSWNWVDILKNLDAWQYKLTKINDYKMNVGALAFHLAIFSKQIFLSV